METGKYTKHKYGFYLYTADNDFIQNYIKQTGEFTSVVNTWIDNNVEPGWLVYDIGANIGEVAEMAAYKGATVHAFEPNPYLNDKWQQKCLEVNCNELITWHPFGLSDKTDILEFKVWPHNVGGSTFSADVMDKVRKNRDWFSGYSETLYLPVRRLDEVGLPNSIPDLLKIDVEGHEELVWRGMPESVKKAKHIIIEIGRYSSDWLIEELLMYGRKCYIENGKYEFDIRKLKKHIDLSVNLLFA